MFLQFHSFHAGIYIYIYNPRVVLPLGFGHGFYLGELDENQVPTQNLRPNKKLY